MTGKSYNSVVELLRDTSDDADLTKELASEICDRQLVKHLVAHRVKNDLSQKEVADRMGCTQSRISKLEKSKDSELGLGDLQQYLKSLDLSLRLVVTPSSQKIVDEIKFHAFSIRQLLLNLVKLASAGDATLAEGIARFACVETPINLLKCVLDAAKLLPEHVLERLPTMSVEDLSLANCEFEESGSSDKLAPA